MGTQTQTVGIILGAPYFVRHMTHLGIMEKCRDPDIKENRNVSLSTDLTHQSLQRKTPFQTNIRNQKFADKIKIDH